MANSLPPSPPAEAIRWPSGCQATQKTMILWPMNSALDLFGLRVPDLGRHAPAGRNNFLAVGADRHTPDFIAVSREVQGFLAFVFVKRRRVPDADGPILAGRGEPSAVRAERDAPTRAGVSAQPEHLSASRRVPDVYGLVFAGRGNAPTIRAEGDAQNGPLCRSLSC